MSNDKPLALVRVDGACPGCGAAEVEAMTPCTVYACGTSSHEVREHPVCFG